jgi:hypothetical protein
MQGRVRWSMSPNQTNCAVGMTGSTLAPDGNALVVAAVWRQNLFSRFSWPPIGHQLSRLDREQT